MKLSTRNRFPKFLTPVVLAAATLSLSAVASAAPTVVFNQTIQGGVSVDASGVSTPHDGTATWYPSHNPLIVQIPNGSKVEHLYAIVGAKSSGFVPEIEKKIRINGVVLSAGSALVGSDTLVKAYETQA